MKYLLSFTAGALLFNESSIYIQQIKNVHNYLQGKESIDYRVIPTNSEASKKRIYSELEKRIKGLPYDFIEKFHSFSVNDQKIIIFLSICCTYKIISEFMVDVVLKKYKTNDNDLSSYDFRYFLDNRLDQDRLENLSETTKNKTSQVAIKILRQMGLFDGVRINEIAPSRELKNLIKKSGNRWFLTCLLLEK